MQEMYCQRGAKIPLEPWEEDANHKLRHEYLLQHEELIGLNEELQCIYTRLGHHFCKTQEEFTEFIKVAKSRIANRPHILNRYEDWEVSNHKQIGSILMGRAKTKEEKELVTRYIQHRPIQ